MAVLAEQLKSIEQTLNDTRSEARDGREQLRTELREMKGEIVGRMERHEGADQIAFKAIDDRVAGLDRAHVAEVAVQKYKRWLIGVGATSGVGLLLTVGKLAIDHWR